MKKVIGIVLLFTISLAVVSSVYAEDGERGPGVGGDMRSGWQKSPHDINAPDAFMVTPERLSSYDEKTKAAWAEIEGAKLKRVSQRYLAIAAALAISIAALGGAWGQSRVAASAMEGIARNPEASSKIFTQLIISMALIESLVIYALVIAILIQGKM